MIVQISPKVVFARPLTRPRTRRIVIHHSVSSPATSVDDIHRWHLARGWSGIGYHYYIDGNGGVWQGRPEWTQGAHAYQDAQHEANTDGIGICLGGNFEQVPPTQDQMQALAELILDIRTRYKDIPVIGHKDVQATACPGKLFPWADLNTKLAKPAPASPMSDAIAVLQQAGIIASPDYWLGIAATGQPARGDYVNALIRNVADYVRRSK